MYAVANLPTTQETEWHPGYSPWRHGGWYTTARYPSGACGCVSNNYTDKKWRIACGGFHGLTFSTRRDAANAEKAMTLKLCEAAKVHAGLLEAATAMVEAFKQSSDVPASLNAAYSDLRDAIKNIRFSSVG